MTTGTSDTVYYVEAISRDAATDKVTYSVLELQRDIAKKIAWLDSEAKRAQARIESALERRQLRKDMCGYADSYQELYRKEVGKIHKARRDILLGSNSASAPRDKFGTYGKIYKLGQIVETRLMRSLRR